MYLSRMLDKQEELQKALGYDFENMSYEERAAYVKEYALHMTVEMGEMLKELPYFKPWKKYDENDIGLAYEKVHEEWIDVVHFFLNISLALGFDAQSMYDEYMDKNKINHERQADTDNYKQCEE